MNAPTIRRVAVLAGARTPFCKAGGALIRRSAVQLGAVAARETLLRAGIRPGLDLGAQLDQTTVGYAVASLFDPSGHGRGLDAEVLGHGSDAAEPFDDVGVRNLRHASDLRHALRFRQ